MPDHIFVADCNGLTSINHLDPKIFKQLTLYCHANFHRLCVWGIINVENHIAEDLQLMIDEGQGVAALNAIKETEYSLPRENMSKYTRNLEKIPNHELDPA